MKRIGWNTWKGVALCGLALASPSAAAAASGGIVSKADPAFPAIVTGVDWEANRGTAFAAIAENWYAVLDASPGMNPPASFQWGFQGACWDFSSVGPVATAGGPLQPPGRVRVQVVCPLLIGMYAAEYFVDTL